MAKKEREAAIEKGLRSVPLRPQDESRFRRPSKSLASAGRSVFIKEGPQEVLPTDSEQQALTEDLHTVVSKSFPHTVGSDSLRTLPTTWQIREQTLVQIADLFPLMTTLEYGLSLRRLVEQAQTGKPTIQNPNAWLKAAFEKTVGHS